MAESSLLYYITDRKAFGADELTRRRGLLDKIAEAAKAGVDYIQLREKDLSTRDLESLASEAMRIIQKLRTENRELRPALLINSRTDVALGTSAAGVHLPANDVSPQAVRTAWHESYGRGRLARELLTTEPLVGVSCHSPEEVNQAVANQASFAVFGPVFEKKESYATGLETLRQACRAKIPVLALGGVNLQNAQSCLDVGAAGIAAIRLFQENDVASVVWNLRG